MLSLAFPLLLSIFFLCFLIVVNLITMCLSVFLLGFILCGTLCTSWTSVTFSFPMLWKISATISTYFLRSFLSLCSFWNPYNVIVGPFNVGPEVSETVLILFILFSLFSSVVVISTTLSSNSLIRSSASFILLLIFSSVLFISVIVLFISVL